MDDKKTTCFRRILESPELELVLGVHNGLSAKIGEEAGFNALWASGLCMSAQCGVRDSNEVSWTQVLEMLEYMADATRVPIMVDGDTGYGNFNNVRRLIRKLEQRGAAAVCIEDKLFPKTNSFIDGDKQQLAEIDEFCSRIKAGKDTQSDADFCIVTRTEALIAGWGMDEALRRAEAYHAAGADGILIHSKSSSPAEVLAFKREWGDRCPVVIVPTKYYSTPVEMFREAGFSMAIWANHLLRAGIVAMQSCARTLASDGSPIAVEDGLATVQEIFRLQGVAELKAAEERYLPRSTGGSRAVVLAASRGKALGELTEKRPKAMVDVAGRPLLSHIVRAYTGVGIEEIAVVRGFAKETIDLPQLAYVDNDEYAASGELESLAKALAANADDSKNLYVSYGDVIFKRYILEMLADQQAEMAIAVDTDWRESVNRNRPTDFVRCSEPHTRRDFNRRVVLERAGEELAEAEVHGEWMGILRVSAPALPRFRRAVAELTGLLEGRRAPLHRLLTHLVREGQEIRVAYTTGNWLDVDSIDDVIAAGSF
jgi:phosphoenolpyruvate phosphomutase